MKKLLAILMIAALAVTIAACGDNQNAGDDPIIADTADETISAEEIAAIRENYDKADAYLVAALGETDMETQEQDDEGGASLYKNWFPNGDEAVNDAISGEIEIDGNKIVIGKTTVKDVKDFDLDVEIYEDTVEPDAIASVTLSKDNKFCSLMTEINATGKAVSVNDLTITNVTTAASDFSLPFSYSSLTAQSTLQDVLDTFGTPNGSVMLSSDNIGTGFELTYYNDTHEGGTVTTNSLTIYMTYDVGSDTAVISSINIDRNSYPEEVE